MDFLKKDLNARLSYCVCPGSAESESNHQTVVAMLALLGSIGIGAAVGAWLRWGLSLWLNPLLPQLPLGTLAANLVGGFLMGVAVAWIEANPGVSAALRLLLVTGFLGGLTTFSTFSAEVVSRLLQGQWSWAAVVIMSHLVASLGATVLGIWVFRQLV